MPGVQQSWPGILAQVMRHIKFVNYTHNHTILNMTDSTVYVNSDHLLEMLHNHIRNYTFTSNILHVSHTTIKGETFVWMKSECG